MSNVKLLLYSTLGGLLFALAWPEIGNLTFLALISFFPLLWVEHVISKQKGKAILQVFFNAYVFFFVFNLLTTWWIYYASLFGVCMAVIFNSLFMAVIFTLFHLTKIKVGQKEGYVAFVIYWLAFEYLHINWELSWIWLTLGHVFANKPSMVQWYEYTGVLGGSILVLVVNLLLFIGLIKVKLNSKITLKYISAAVLLILSAYLISIRISNNITTGDSFVEVVIVQPNIDPYNEKFTSSPSQQIDKMMALASEKLTANTDYLIFPETAIPEPHWDHEVNFLYATEKIREFSKENPKLKTIIGSLSSHLFTPNEKLTPAAREFRDGTGYYENYNSAIYLDHSKEFQMHIKSKLVLGVEKIPFINYIPLMKKLTINLGGAAGGYGSTDKPNVFFSKNDSAVIAPIICYESIYGEYVTEYTKQGANLFAIITNDGWWENTPGHRQHLAYARLRAIENRRAIVRSANTGISAVINQKGELLQQTKWWEPAVISTKVQLNEVRTFYAKYGDYLGRIAAFVAILLLLLTLVKSLNKTGKRLNR